MLSKSHWLTISISALSLVSIVSRADTYLIDVRSPQEYREKHALNAHNIPHDNIDIAITDLTKDKSDTLYLYCRSGRRAEIAAERLRSLGYEHIINLGTLSAAIEAKIETSD